MFTAADYDRYLVAFNARDYDTLETFFTDDFVLENGGFAARGKQAFREFYAFVHDCVRETVKLIHFFPGEKAFAANVLINFTGLKDMTPEMLKEKGLEGMTPVPKGASVDIEFNIVYELNEQGLIHHIKGAVYIPAP